MVEGVHSLRQVQILRLVEQAGDEARGVPAGTIRISCTAALGALHISRLIFAFQDRYPRHRSRPQPDRRARRPGPRGVDIAHHRSLSRMRMRIVRIR